MNKFSFDAVIFDLDGVITQTALVHAKAWKLMFDEFLMSWSKRIGKPFMEFTHTDDYLPYIDGKPRYNGVESFLMSRGIQIPYGSPTDSPEEETVCGLGNKKNKVFNELVERDGVATYESTIELIKQLKAEGIKLGVASSSRNCRRVLEITNLLHYFDTRVDGEVSVELGLHGKPEPDIFTVACDNLGVDYYRAIVVEDAVSGVQAGLKGNFGFVLGVAREENALDLKMHGADVVVTDLSEIDGLNGLEKWFDQGLNNELWSITRHGYDTSAEKSAEDALTVGNGYLSTRGSLEESDVSPYNYPGTYMAGVYNSTRLINDDGSPSKEFLVNLPNWLPITFKVAEGEWFDPNHDEVIELERKLNFRSGVLYKRMLVRDRDDRETLIESRRFVSMANQHHAAIDYSLTPLNYSGFVRVKSAISTPIKNSGVDAFNQYNQDHLVPLKQGGKDNLSYVTCKTSQSQIQVAVAAKLEVFYQERPLATNYRIKYEDGWVNSYIKASVKEGESLRVEKLVSICSSNLETTPNPLDFVLEDIKQLKSFGIMHAASLRAWEKIWDKADIQLLGDRLAQKQIRRSIFMALTSSSPHSAEFDLGLFTRQPNTELLQGQFYWDELLSHPFYSIHFPNVARASLMYRYNRLGEARNIAKQSGLSGAMFPAQSGGGAGEVYLAKGMGSLFEVPNNVSVAVAASIWNYYNISGDVDFVRHFGAEMYIEIARFLAGQMILNGDTGKYESNINYGGVLVKNGAYVNLMTSWVLKNASNIVATLDEESKSILYQKINFEKVELDKWVSISNKIHLNTSEDGIIEQFDGYFDSSNRVKRSDILMAMYLIEPSELSTLVSDMGYKLPKDFMLKNLEYYMTNCSNFADSCGIIIANTLNKLGRKKQCMEQFTRMIAAEYFNPIEVNSTALSGWGATTNPAIIALTCFGGVSLSGEMLSINPNLPKHWTELNFTCTFRGVEYQIAISANSITACAGRDNATLQLKGETFTLNANEEIRVKLS